jgi:hypothetical protein
MTEQEAWTLMAAYSNNNALYFLANIIAVCLGFVMSSKIYESDNAPTIARLLATTYCLCIAFFMYNALSASLTMISDFSWVFSELSKTRGISAISQEIIDFDSTVQSLVNVIFVLSIFTYQMLGVWMKKSN